MKRPLFVIFVAFMVVLAGCAGGTTDALGSDDTGGEETPTDDEVNADRDAETSDPIDDPDAVGDALEVTDVNVEGIPPDEEYIVLSNTGEDPVDLSGFEIRDREGGQVDRGFVPFQFPTDFALEAGESVTIWTGSGDASETDLYWGYGVNIWSGDGDVVTLIAPNGAIVLEHAYGDVDLDHSDTDDTDDGDAATDDSDDDDSGTDVSDEPDTDVDGELEIHHIDVGQADSTLVITPEDETILIDTGDWRQDGADVLDYLDQREIDRIDHLVATHAHADHIGGHAALIEHFEEHGDGIGAAYDSGVPTTTNTYENYLDAVEAYGVDLLLVEEGDELPIDGDVTARVLNPPVDTASDDLHYNSVSLAIEFGEFQYVTTGDAEADAETRLVEEWESDLEADVYQAGHHGSSTSSTEPFMGAMSPAIAVISSAYDSQYGHPSDEVLDRFAAHGIETYWTAVHGDIVITTDGSTIDVETTEEFSTDAEDIAAETPNDDDTASTIAPTPSFDTSQALVSG